jgi:hypothetical protein
MAACEDRLTFSQEIRYYLAKLSGISNKLRENPNYTCKEFETQLKQVNDLIDRTNELRKKVSEHQDGKYVETTNGIMLVASINLTGIVESGLKYRISLLIQESSNNSKSVTP